MGRRADENLPHQLVNLPPPQRPISPSAHCPSRTPVTKYAVSPKQLVGTPRCSSYSSTTRPLCATASSSRFATVPSRTLNSQRIGAEPGIVEIWSSPSQVLQIHPLCENFCSAPARWPSEYEKCSTTQVQRTTVTIGMI